MTVGFAKQDVLSGCLNNEIVGAELISKSMLFRTVDEAEIKHVH